MGVNLPKSYSKMNEAIVKLFDESGVRRSFTVPYIDGQAMGDHVNAVKQAASSAGGATNNLILSAHHSEGKGWGSGDGHTVGHSADKLRTTIIPSKDEHAKEAIDAAQSHLNNMKKLLGDDAPEIQTAQGQLDLVKKTDGAGMTLLDFGVLLTQLMYKPMQTLARMHSGSKQGGPAAHLRAPGDMTPAPAEEQAQAAPQGEEEAGGDQEQAAAPNAEAQPEQAQG